MKPVVDRDTCIGSASCVGVAPDVFELDDEFKSTVTNPGGADDDAIMQAAEACPVQAITVLDDEGKQVYP